jgi:hypothetical protein
MNPGRFRRKKPASRRHRTGSRSWRSVSETDIQVRGSPKQAINSSDGCGPGAQRQSLWRSDRLTRRTQRLIDETGARFRAHLGEPSADVMERSGKNSPRNGPLVHDDHRPLSGSRRRMRTVRAGGAVAGKPAIRQIVPVGRRLIQATPGTADDVLLLARVRLAWGMLAGVLPPHDQIVAAGRVGRIRRANHNPQQHERCRCQTSRKDSPETRDHDQSVPNQVESLPAS